MKTCGHRRAGRWWTAGQLRALARRGHELVHVVVEERDVPARAVLEDEGDAAGGADAGNGRRRRRRRRSPSGIFRSSRVEVAPGSRRSCSSGRVRSDQGLKVDEEERAVGVVDRAEEVEADDRGVVLHARRVFRTSSTLRRRRRRPLKRGRVGQLQRDVDVALVLLRQEAGGQLPPRTSRAPAAKAPQDQQADDALVDQGARNADVAVGGPREPPVEPAEEPPQRPAAAPSAGAAAGRTGPGSATAR